MSSQKVGEFLGYALLALVFFMIVGVLITVFLNFIIAYWPI